MKTKFKESDIEINGVLTLNIRHSQDGFRHCYKEQINIPVNGSKGKTKSGIYCLRNKLHPERYYIGMARNLESRYSHHMSDLSLHKHINAYIQLDWDDADGVFQPQDLFEMEVIIYCRPSELTFYENILINNLHPYYNIHKTKKFSELDENKQQELIEEQADRYINQE